MNLPIIVTPKVKTVYLNWAGPQGRETVDELTQEQGQPWQAFRTYIREMVREYNLTGMDVYTSSRPCKNWK